MRLFKRKIKERGDNIEFFIKDKKYIINSVPIRLYYELLKIKDESLESRIKTISILSGCPEEDLNDTEFYIIQNLYSIIKDKFLTYNKQLKIRKSLMIKDKRYNLVNINKLTSEEYTDINVLSYLENKLHHQIAILYRLDGEKVYNDEIVQSRLDDFLEVDVRDVQATISFFLSTAKKSLNLLLFYLEMKSSKNIKPVIKNLRLLMNKQDLDGSDSSVSSQMMTISKLKKSLEAISENV